MKKMIFAANWKMHHGPSATNEFFTSFLADYQDDRDRAVWFFPPDVSLSATVELIRDREHMLAGAQNIYWEPKGAFTGETSVAMAADTGARAALVGHSERRHVFGETDEETGKKVRALLAANLTPVLCVGEKIEERKAGSTLAVVSRQLAVLAGLTAAELGRTIIAYEPVWAIGTGLNATPEDAAAVHAEIRKWLVGHGCKKESTHILYGGSVKPTNSASLVAQDEIDGVLVGGASLDPASWNQILRAGLD
jgi:triosephosphate isomerase